ncbi:MAG: GNAT family N-acetyltransferase [Halobacteriales archaeon]|nr:GNAT family N-acetyltransferase [Halobacteriales archaeon]
MPEIRPAIPEDVDAIRDVADAAWWDTYPGTLDAAQIETAVDRLYDPEFLTEVLGERDDLLFLVAERDGEVVGFGSAQQTFADEVELFTLYVDPDHQREGVGTALLDAILETARTESIDRLRVGILSGNQRARSFFESHGFERIETVTTEVADQPHPEDLFERTVA